jgi:hypothetical protein
MSEDTDDRLGEVIARLDTIAQRLEAQLEESQKAVAMMEEIHRAWCLRMEQEHRRLPEAVKTPVGPGSLVSWTDPTDASNAAWSGKVEFVGVDAAGKAIAHVDFGRYGRRNLPVDQLIVGILT